MKNLVLIHGWGFSGEVFSDLASLLREKAQVKVIDLPGYGEKHSVMFSDSLQKIAEEIAQEIDNSSVVIGWSLGGLVALQLAIDFPDKVESLIMVAATPCFIQQPDWVKAADSKLSRQFYQQVEENGELALNSFYKQLAAMERSPRNTLQEIKRLQRDCNSNKENLLQSLNVLHNSDLRDQLLSTSKKITWVYGDNDQLVPAQHDALTKHSKVEIIAGAGHLPFISQQDECLKLIEEAVK